MDPRTQHVGARASVGLVAAMLLTLTPATASAQAGDPFPQADPENVGLSSEALGALADVVQGYIDREMAVGAELLVIKDRRTVLHEAFGWRDRESELPMERDTIFNIRSMTKPVTGAAAQILIDEGRLALDDRVAAHLPGFDHAASDAITIEQLLTHTSGLPLSTMASVDQFEDLQAMANAAGEDGPEFEPGSRFWYSDTGADTLGAVVEQVAGSSLDDFVAERLLQPLGMDDSWYAHGPADVRRDRMASLYVGRVGEWARFWGPEADPFYPFAWGSQSLYATPRDYARFLAMWLDAGQSGSTSVLSPEAVSRTLTPVLPMGQLGSDAPYPTRFPDLTVYHGQMALLHVADGPVEGAPEGTAPEILGYSGSDGTIAWAWPDRDLIILYFTQSRGGSTPLRLEAEIDRLLLHPPAGPVPEMPAAYDDLLGTYYADFGPFVNEPFDIVWRDGKLVLDIPSLFIFGLEPTGTDERWTVPEIPGTELEFERDGSGVITSLRFRQGGSTFELPKGQVPQRAEVTLTPQEAEPYLGWYREERSDREVEVVLQAGRLALRIPETPEPLELFPPTEDGGWRVRMSPAVAIHFVEGDDGFDSYVARGPGGESTFTRFDRDESSTED